MIELKNLTYKEIQPFFNSLSDERDLSESLYVGMLPVAKFVTVARTDKELAGIGGIIEWPNPILRRFIAIPIFFISVKSQFRRKGVGKAILQKIITFTKERYSCLTLTTDKSEEYSPAVNLYLKNGFKFYSSRIGIQYYMCLPFCKRGEIVCRFSSLLYICYIFYRSSVGSLIRSIRSHLPQFLRKSSHHGRHKGQRE